MTLKENLPLLSNSARMKIGSSGNLSVMQKFITLVIICSLFLISRSDARCNDDFLKFRCKKLLKASYTSECRGDVLQLFPKCLFMASECKAAGQITDKTYVHSQNLNYSKAYDVLIEKVKMYRRCFSRNSLKCNESMIKNCYEDFEQNATKTCREVHKLRFCILLLQPRGCHEMRNPWYTLAVGIIKSYRPCFIRNYTIMLEALQQRKQVPTAAIVSSPQINTTAAIVSCGGNPKAVERNWDAGYTFLCALFFFCFLILLVAVFLVKCIRKTRTQSKGRRRLLNSQMSRNADSMTVNSSRTCVTTGRTPLTYIIEEDEAPPPYSSERNGMYTDGIDSPPPYTSRPTSVNGDFV